MMLRRSFWPTVVTIIITTLVLDGNNNSVGVTAIRWWDPRPQTWAALSKRRQRPQRHPGTNTKRGDNDKLDQEPPPPPVHLLLNPTTTTTTTTTLLRRPSRLCRRQRPSTSDQNHNHDSTAALASLSKTRRRRQKSAAGLSSKQQQPTHQRSLPQQQQQSSSNHHLPFVPRRETLIASVTHYFQPSVVMVHHGTDLHTPRLLRACRQLERVMRHVGQRANANELHRNIQKVQVAYDAAPPSDRETVSQLLRYETNVLGLHGPGGAIHDPSAAVGLLWLRRSLEFQQKLYAHAILAPSTTSTHLAVGGGGASTTTTTTAPSSSSSASNSDSTAAALKAYRQTLEKHHGWKMQRLYTLALRSTTPSRSDMIRTLSGVEAVVPPPRSSSVSSSSSSSRNSSRSSRRRSATTTDARQQQQSTTRAASSENNNNGQQQDPPTPSLTPQQERILEQDLRQLLGVWKPVSTVVVVVVVCMTKVLLCTTISQMRLLFCLFF